MSRRSLPLRSLLLAGALALFAAPAAAADSSTSTNWSGYVAHGVRFRTVSALWTEPNLSCIAGQQTYSAAWVGLGGYKLTSKALEQVGTEADCEATGKQSSTAWYELVPAPSRPLAMAVHPGDVMAGHVTAVGNKVTLALTDRTRHKTFTKKFTDYVLDVTSADWILEAPSECGGNGFQCQPLALADFGSETFARAGAETASGHTGAISSRRWRTSVITLSPSNGGRVYAGNQPTTVGQSTPSSLMESGTSFTLTYAPITAVTGQPAPTYGTMAAWGPRARSATAIEPGGTRG